MVFPRSLDSLPSLQKFKHLRVLDLEDCKRLQAHHLTHLGRLFALRYLSFRNTLIDELPEEIGELQYLQTLDIRGTHIKELPSSVGRLSRLVTLLCDSYVRLPDGFGKNMQALQQLVGATSVRYQSPSFAQELRQLRNLRILEILFDDEVSEDLVVSSLCTLGTGCLNSLVIGFHKKHMKLVMEPWSPTLHGLKILHICLIVVPRVPRWIGSLDNLQEFILCVEQLWDGRLWFAREFKRSFQPLSLSKDQSCWQMVLLSRNTTGQDQRHTWIPILEKVRSRFRRLCIWVVVRRWSHAKATRAVSLIQQ